MMLWLMIVCLVGVGIVTYKLLVKKVTKEKIEEITDIVETGISLPLFYLAGF